MKGAGPTKELVSWNRSEQRRRWKIPYINNRHTRDP
jgi:hypothetical protein